MSDTAATQPAGVTIKDPSNQSDTIAGGNGSDILVSDAGNDKLHGLGGTDTYVINNTNYDRTVQINDIGENRLAVDGGRNMMKLSIQKDRVLLDDQPLKQEADSPAFIYETDHLTVKIVPDSDIDSDAKKTRVTANPLLQHMSGLQPENKLRVLNLIQEKIPQHASNHAIEDAPKLG